MAFKRIKCDESRTTARKSRELLTTIERGMHSPFFAFKQKKIDTNGPCAPCKAYITKVSLQPQPMDAKENFG